jgi:hypothetical protein
MCADAQSQHPNGGSMINIPLRIQTQQEFETLAALNGYDPIRSYAHAALIDSALRSSGIGYVGHIDLRFWYGDLLNNVVPMSQMRAARHLAHDPLSRGQ